MATASVREAATNVASALSSATPLCVLGADGSILGVLLAEAAARAAPGRPIVALLPDDAAARRVAIDAAFFLGARPDDAGPQGEGPVLVVPDVDTPPYADVSPDPRAVGARLAALHRASSPDRDAPRLIVFGLRSFMRKTMPRSAFAARCRMLAVGDEIDREDTIAALVGAGYARADVVEDPGTFAVRGGVMDLWVPRQRFPCRVEWFGDEIERLRLFDPQSQRSLRPVESCEIHPARETVRTTAASLRERVLALGDATEVPTSRSRQVIENLEQELDFFGIDALTPIFHDEMVPVHAYLPEGSQVLVEEPDALAALAERIEAETAESFARARADHRLVGLPADLMLDADAVRSFAKNACVHANRLDLYDPEREDDRPVLRIRSEANVRLHADLEAARRRKGEEVLRPAVEHIRRLQAEPIPWRVLLAAPNTTHAERLTSLLRGYGLSPRAPRPAEEGPPVLQLVREPPQKGSEIQVVAGELSAGFSSEDDRLLVLSEADLFGRVTRRAQARRRKAAGLGNLAQLRVGDYVVHVMHGVGRYIGLVKLAPAGGVPGDFVLVEYAGGDKLYLPVVRLGEVERYAAAEGKPPKLDRMGGSTFETKQRRVRSEVRQMAEELLQIYAQREAAEGHAFPRRDDLYAAFESTFPFEETPDQLDAIEAVQHDLSRPRPMDRLICGDVGFGKTEVALRAAFRVAASGKQVAVLAPTTVLVEQHYHTFAERMSPFGVKVEHVSRFVSGNEKKRVVAGIRDGSIDVVVGTHRLLSSDVRFHDLGLLVIDEEQRFGVAQKERFKRLKTKVDVLALSATPIPRTLHLSLLGIREISLVMTPPVDRLAIRTLLTRPSDRVIEEGVRKELARGGQVFYVVPKIQGIDEHAVRVRQLVPEARVLVAHGQMPAEMLEKAMVDFVEHRADVLVSTTIIESGLDIPRANPMYGARADQFGLSQLYQLRGRIGRAKRRAYCHLMVPSLEKLAPEARRRLEAIQRHAELGSGFSVASEDLEIRGAGEILGGKQSGHIAAIGFDAYARVLQEAVAELRGDPIVHEADPELAFDVPAFLPDAYVEDVGQRLDLYRRLSTADGIDAVGAVMDEVRDRFGDPPQEAKDLGRVMACKSYGRRLHALAVELRADRLTVRLSDRTPMKPEVAANLAKATSGRVTLQAGDRLVARLPHKDRLGAAVDLLAELAVAAGV
jgi:transcription-repair coupling factor (superfamily II helicase)